ncbi:MAG: hypothetical protein HY291_04445 [Planctomycetes bacterium]|nr:hypothetical protein [Planctomycetota bacterium]
MSKEASSPVADSSTAHETIKDQKESARMPGGSIELLYCEKCGGLILGGIKNALPAPNGAGHYCKKCGAAAGKPGNDTAPVLPAASPGETKEVAKRRPSSVSMPAAKRESAANARSKVLEPQNRSKRQAASGKSDEQDSSKLLIGAGVGVAVLVLLGVMLLGGSSKSGEASKTASAAKTETAVKEPERRPTVPASESTPAKIILPATPRNDAPVEAKAEPAPAHEQPKAQEEAGKLQKEAGEKAPETPATPSAKANEEKTPEPDKKADTAKDQGAIEDKKKKDEEEDISKQPAKTETKAPANPFSVGEGGAEDPTKVLPGQKPAQPATPPAAQAKPKPAFERGKQCALFPADRESKTVDHQSPAMAQGQKSGINETKYDGWSFMGQKLDAWNVKGGILSFNNQCALTLDGFPSKDFDLKMEVELGGKSALAVMLGSANEGISLMAILPNAVLPGVWDQTKTQNNVQMDNKAAKPTGVKENWIPIRITVVQGMVEVFAGNKSVYKEKVSNPTKFPQFGFLVLGVSNNPTPTAKIRNATLFAP